MSPSLPVTLFPPRLRNISTASWVEICDNSPSVHRLPPVANPRQPPTTSLGRRKPAPVVATAPQRKQPGHLWAERKNLMIQRISILSLSV